MGNGISHNWPELDYIHCVFTPSTSVKLTNMTDLAHNYSAHIVVKYITLFVLMFLGSRNRLISGRQCRELPHITKLIYAMVEV